MSGRRRRSPAFGPGVGIGAGLALGLGLTLALVLAPAAPAQKGAPDLGTDEQRAAGQKLYAKWCSQCHGDAGDGNGIAAPHLSPRPRDFTAGKYKLRSTPAGALPTDADLRRSIRDGLPYTAMPAFPQFSDAEVDDLIAYLKSFSPSFADPDRYRDPVDLPSPPAYSDEAAEKGKEIYEQLGCAPCHGPTGRGNGTSAPGQRDDWGRHIRPADLSQPWTFRGGATRADVFRSISTGLYGTPMAGFAGSIPPEDLWKLVDFIVSLSGNRTEAPYAEVVTAVGVEDDLDPEKGEELFASAPPALVPLVGQIMEPGRDFYPATRAIEVRAVFNRKEIAFLLKWHDMRAETSGHNAPDVAVPASEEEPAEAAKPGGGEEEGGFWGDAAADEGGGGGEEDGGGGDFWGDAAAPSGGDQTAAGEEGGGFWDEETGGGGAAASTPETEFSDAVGIQLPAAPPQGVVKPYFIFGDATNAVELLYVDLGAVGGGEGGGGGKVYLGRGSESLTAGEGDPPVVRAAWGDDGWSVVVKRARLPRAGVGFAEDTFVPIAFTVWDGFHRERGNRRALSAWHYVYVRPTERPSPVGPIAKAAATVLALELALIAWVRRRQRHPVNTERPQ